MTDVDVQTVTVQAFGLTIRLGSSPSHLLRHLLDLLPEGWRTVSHSTPNRSYFLKEETGECQERRIALWADDRPLLEGNELEHALDCFESDLQITIGDHCPDRVFVHAGVVGWNGQAVVLPGPSQAGKSTLVAELLRRGTSYYSDEFAVIRPNGMIDPYPRRLSLRQAMGRPLRPAARSLGGARPSGPVAPALIVFTEFRAGGSWRPETLPLGPAVLELMKHCLSARRRPAAAVDSLTRFAARSRAFRGVRGEADAMADWLFHELTNPESRPRTADSFAFLEEEFACDPLHAMTSI